MKGLLICDCDEVLLHMVRHFGVWLRERHDMACYAEVPLANGRRADVLAVGPKGEIWIIEIKTSIEDFRVDRKWPDYLQHCDRLFFATHPGVPADIFPESCGLIVSDGYGAEILREAPENAFVSLLADGEAHRLYAQFGFEPTAPHAIGMAWYPKPSN